MTANQIIETYYKFIKEKAAVIDSRNKHDLAHDIVEKILNLPQHQIDKLSQNPKGYIYIMMVNHLCNIKKVEKKANESKSELLYINKGCYELINSSPIEAIKKLPQEYRHLLAAVMVYPEEAVFARKTGIARNTANKRIKNLKDRLTG